jgi:hypothetical protein
MIELECHGLSYIDMVSLARNLHKLETLVAVHRLMEFTTQQPHKRGGGSTHARAKHNNSMQKRSVGDHN